MPDQVCDGRQPTAANSSLVVYAGHLLNNPYIDGAASIVIGIVLAAVALSSGTVMLRLAFVILIDDGVMRYRDPALNSDVTLHFATAAPWSDNPQPTIRFNGESTVRKRTFAIKGRGAALLSLRETSKPYRVQTQAHAGPTHISFGGTFVPLQLQDVNGDFELDGPDMPERYPIIPIPPLPWTPAHHLSGHLTHQNHTWSFRQFDKK